MDCTSASPDPAHAGAENLEECGENNASPVPVMAADADADADADAGDEGHGVGQIQSFFVEKDQVIEATVRLCGSSLAYERETILTELTKVLLKYQEQPHLLGPHIEDLVRPVNEALVYFAVSTPQNEQDEVYLLDLCKFVQVCCRVRGFKQVAKHLPHEVYQLESCCELLARQDKSNYDSWETRYVLLLWLSSLVLIPFDLTSMDSRQGSGPDLVQRLISAASIYIGDPGPTREAAGFCLANLLTRPDMESQHLKYFLDSASAILTKTQESAVHSGQLCQSYFKYIGILSCLNQIFKRGHRSKLFPLAHQIYTPATALAAQSVQTVERKLLCKLIQRMGMTFLPPKEATWRYQRGQRSLQTTLGKVVVSAAVVPEAAVCEDGDEEVEYPAELEDIIGIMLSFLSDKDTVVRWSAAKGIGRIAMRLSKALASDVVDALFGVFEDTSSDMNWHGGCLAIAELARRGLLLPEKLDVATKLINQGMQFDLLRGQHSVGAHVRDAACYVCWAFARAYSPKDLAPYRNDLFSNMLLTSLFDREVNCRRAASAALQEFVGRQGHEHFTESLSIISIADFFAVGNRTSSYLELSPAIAALDVKYLNLFLDHLLDESVNHWDEEVRDIASKAIARLLMVDPSSAGDRLKVLLPRCSSTRLADRHGALLAMSTILFCLSRSQALSAEIVMQIEGLLTSADKLRLFRGKGGELVREAVCRVMEALARTRIKIAQKSQVALIELLIDQLKQPHENVQRAAQAALRISVFTFFCDALPTKSPTEKLQALTVGKFLATLKNEGNVAITRGFCLALGTLPERLAVLPAGERRLDAILDVLDDYASSEKRILGDHDPETSRNSVEAVIELAERLCESPAFSAEHLSRCFDLLFKAGEDYSVDKRGDTGSWCRILALEGLERLIYASFPRILRGGSAWSHDAIVGGKGSQIRWMTAFGLGAVQEVSAGSCGPVAIVAFPAQSLGAAQSDRESWTAANWQPRGCLVSPVNPCYTSTSAEEPTEECAGDVAGWTALQPGALLARVVRLVLKQMAEKLDAVREVAGGVLWRLLQFSQHSQATEALRCEALGRILSAIEQAAPGAAQHIQWGMAGQTYPILAKIMGVPDFAHSVFSGLIVSVGGVSKSIAKSAADSLLLACQEQSGNSAFFRAMAASIAQLFSQNKRSDRVVVPLMKTMELLLKNNKYAALTEAERGAWVRETNDCLQAEVKKCSSIPKINAAIDSMSLLITVQQEDVELARAVLLGLLRMLAHKYPKTRKHCAEVLYLFFLSAPAELLRGDADLCCDTLLTTPWDCEDANVIFAGMNGILTALGFEAVVRDSAAVTKARAAKAKKSDELDSYEALVREAGY